MQLRRWLAPFAVVGVLAMSVVAAAAEPIVVYSGRSKALVEPVVRAFESETGLRVQVRYGDTAQLALTLIEEGQRTAADVYWGQDAGALGALAEHELLMPLDDATLGAVPEAYRSPTGRWVATSGRARTLAYSPQRVDTANLPKSVFDLTDSRYRGRVGWAPTNGSFQAFVTAMRRVHGDERTLAWLKAMKDNAARVYPKNSAIIQGIAAGEIDFGLPNHYYLLRFKAQDADYPVEQTAFAAGDVGNLVNVAGVGVVAGTDQADAARRFVNFLLSPQAQTYFTQVINEYPVTESAIGNDALSSPKELQDQAPQVDLDTLEDLQGTLDLLREAGLL